MEKNIEILKIALQMNHYGNVDNLIINYIKLYSLIYETEDNTK